VQGQSQAETRQRPPRASPWRWLLAASLAIATVLAPASESRFQRTVDQLQFVAPEQEGDFAAIALAELVEVFAAEAGLARSQAREVSGESRARLLGWSAAVDQYADDLLLLVEGIDKGAAVQLRRDPEGTVTVVVEGRRVILLHPRPDQQTAFEQRVLSGFCAAHDCEQLTASATPPQEPIPISAGTVYPHWNFAPDGTSCENDGITVRFGGTQQLAALRRTCEELLLEADALAVEIAWQQRHGVEVDWANLQISSTPGQPEHRIRLNDAGDSILLTIPVLYGSPGLLEALLPWLSTRYSDEPVVPVRLDAARYGWGGTPD